ncbi:hypothetical protein EJP617_08040 [Erwinia sp. Ejp617]|nr:hypothetical protein [Erwinia sp. Ejp617]ADP10485.1 hypothetical protein EJP617_08040 [Erwinia sp. Ejp617]
MKDFQSEEFRSHFSPVLDLDADNEFSVENMQLAEIELDNEILLATHRC